MPDNDPARADARRSRRLSPQGATRLEAFRAPDGLGPDIAVRILDISATGARLVLSERLPTEHVLGVALYGAQRLPIACAASVIWTLEAQDGTFITGVRFSAPAGEENLASVARPE